MMNLKGKRILFICVKLFGIEQQIASEMLRQGAEVDYYDERPTNTFIVKALIRLNRNLIYRYIEKYHKRIIKETKNNQYDYIFFIKGEAFSEKNLKELFANHPSASTIIYHWDSISNNNNAKRILAYFENKFSFDRKDCMSFGMSFLPLFYYNEYSSISEKPKTLCYDVLFIGTAHSDRYRLVSNIKRQIEKYGGKCFSFFYFQGKIMFYKYRFLNREARTIPKVDVNFKALSKDEILELYSQSRIILDIHHPKQTGLTLRTMESLGSKRKLITTNEDIKNYDFYDPVNILVIDRKNPIIPKEFIHAEYRDIDSEIYRNYSISAWIEKIFSKNNR